MNINSNKMQATHAARDRGASLAENGEDLSDRLLIVAREFTRGGAALLAVRHARALRASHPLDLLVTGPCDEDLLEELPAGVCVYRIDCGPLHLESYPVRMLHRFRRAHRHMPPFQRHYRAVLATSIFPDLTACAAFAAVRASRRFLFLVDEGLKSYAEFEPAERNFVNECIVRADRVLPVSRRLWEHMAQACPALRERPWSVVRPPIEAKRILAQAKEPQSVFAQNGVPVVLTVARFVPDKQIVICLRVHHRLKQEGLRFHWYVIGSGPEEPAIRSECQALGMEQEFHILPFQNNIYSCLNNCDVFALFSCSEGCPTVVAEALLLGRPVVMTDVNGADELIEHGRTGLVVANDAEAIAGGLGRMLRDEPLRRRISAALSASAADLDRVQADRTLADLITANDPEGLAPRVSILIPTYRQEQYIDSAIASALAQDYPSLEVIVVDDASPDRTGEAARLWDFDPRFRYVRNDRNRGRVANYRYALNELARGEWVLMLDGDDFLADPGFIRRAIEAIDRHHDRPIVFAQAGHRVHYLNGKLRDADILPPIGCEERVMTGGDYLQFVFETTFFTHLGTLYHRARAIDARFYTAEISSSDMDSLLRLALEGEVLVLNTIAGFWVQHGSNASSGLALGELLPNVRIFREIARQAVRKGHPSWQQLRGPLTRYESQTLVHLFSTTIGKTSCGLWDLVRFLKIAVRINPRLFADRLFVSGCVRFARKLTGLSARRFRAGRLAAAGWQRLRLLKKYRAGRLAAAGLRHFRAGYRRLFSQ